MLNLHKNIFAERLSPFGFDIFPALVVDLMHEFELGVLKSVLKHLIRILYAIDADLVSTLNERLVFLIYYRYILIFIAQILTQIFCDIAIWDWWNSPFSAECGRNGTASR